jgi:hypothetical protein
VVREAAAIFERARLGQAYRDLWAGAQTSLRVRAGEDGCFLAKRVSNEGERGQWRSDLAWISVDDPPTYRAFEALFQRSRLAATFAPVVEHDHTLRLYTAFYVVRTACAAPYFHTDFGRAVGHSALVMMTPLDDFAPSAHTDENAAFQLLYEAGDPEARGDTAPGEVRQYDYKRGKAIVFSSRFRHATQPGKAANAPHVYLCFVFGTDRTFHWPAIVQALEYLQSRMIARPDGGIVYNPPPEDV